MQTTQKSQTPTQALRVKPTKLSPARTNPAWWPTRANSTLIPAQCAQHSQIRPTLFAHSVSLALSASSSASLEELQFSGWCCSKCSSGAHDKDTLGLHETPRLECLSLQIALHLHDRLKTRRLDGFSLLSTIRCQNEQDFTVRTCYNAL